MFKPYLTQPSFAAAGNSPDDTSLFFFGKYDTSIGEQADAAGVLQRTPGFVFFLCVIQGLIFFCKYNTLIGERAVESGKWHFRVEDFF